MPVRNSGRSPRNYRQMKVEIYEPEVKLYLGDQQSAKPSAAGIV